MERVTDISLHNKYIRHGLFWLGWVLGFTFIKSIGESMEVYIAWLIYYLVTLPVFMLHTYFIIYRVAPRNLSGYRIFYFILIFFAAMVFFSFLELLITNELLARLFPAVFPRNRLYLDPGTVVISGIGNLYVLLVFVALKMIRSWTLADQKKKEIIQRKLIMERADANAFIQPGMLLHVISLIESLSRVEKDEVPVAIARLSELLNLVRQAHKQLLVRLDEEVRNVRRLIDLYAMLMGKIAPALHVSGEVIAVSKLPAFMIFTPLEVLLRKYRMCMSDKIEIEILTEHQISISWKGEFPNAIQSDETLVKSELDRLFPGQFNIAVIREGDLSTLLIRRDSVEVFPSVRYGE